MALGAAEARAAELESDAESARVSSAAKAKDAAAKIAALEDRAEELEGAAVKSQQVAQQVERAHGSALQRVKAEVEEAAALEGRAALDELAAKARTEKAKLQVIVFRTK